MEALSDYLCLRRKFLVYNFTSRNLKIKYRRSFLGYFWSLLVPLAQAGVYYFVFKVILHIQIPNYVAYIVSGVLLWTFFSNTLAYGMEGLTSNRSLLTKIPMPLQIFPLVETISNFTTLVFALPVLLGILVFTSMPGFEFLFFLYYALTVAFIAYGIAVFLGIASVVFADLKHVFSLVVQLWMYATPVFYHESMIPAEWKWVLALNPVGLSFTGMHQAVIEHRIPDALHLGIPLAWSFLATILGMVSLAVAKRRGIVELL